MDFGKRLTELTKTYWRRSSAEQNLELQTLTTEIEAILNDRSLAYVSSQIKNDHTLSHPVYSMAEESQLSFTHFTTMKLITTRRMDLKLSLFNIEQSGLKT